MQTANSTLRLLLPAQSDCPQQPEQSRCWTNEMKCKGGKLKKAARCGGKLATPDSIFISELDTFVTITYTRTALCAWELLCDAVLHRQLSCLRKCVCFFCSKRSVSRKGAKTTLSLPTSTNPSWGNSRVFTPSLHLICRSCPVFLTVSARESGKNSFQSLVFTTSFFPSWPKTLFPRLKYPVAARRLGASRPRAEGQRRPLAVYGGRTDSPSLRQWKCRMDARFQRYEYYQWFGAIVIARMLMVF